MKPPAGPVPPEAGGADERRGQERAEHDRARAAGGGRSRRGRRGGRGAAAPEAAPEVPAAGAPGAALSLAEAFELLKRALREVGAFAPTTVNEDLVRERMEAMHGGAQDPLFHRPRFGRLLRQAHDAEIVDLAKNERGFEVALRAEAAQVPAEEPAPEPRRGRGGRGGRRGRGRGGEAGAAETRTDTAAPDAPTAPPAPSASAPVAHAHGIRYRRGSVRPHAPAAGVPLVGVVEVEGSEPAQPAESKGRTRSRIKGGAGRRPTGRGRTRKKPGEPSSES